ncbi:HK97 family phage prohead protease [Mycolicibacterium sp. CBM1]
MTDIERRFASLETAITGNKIGGYAAVFNQRTDLGPYTEVLASTAFRSALASPTLNVAALLNHNEDKLLARTTNNSLRLSADSHGLQFEFDLNPDLSITNDVRAMVESGLITGCSFAFRMDPSGSGQNWTRDEGRDLRTITSIASLHDVSVVTYPAYDGTAVSLRNKPTQAIDGRTQMFRARFGARYNRKV